ncbi:DUF6438 domain-containing protein [Hymenobacter sp.]|uniref:DUF6438 domain-containing protein n=1 Tax=Hymenobacter sp. TaxID=1898978 RepID=UPI00286D190E|nr:DUF6438 domain-containing protein [Hymenobacter sp.]
MRHLAFLLLLVSCAFALPACAQKATAQKTSRASKREAAARAAKAKNDPGPVLTFERTPCFGFCPAYTMQVFADGRVAYEGRRAVPLMGQKEFRLPAGTVADMLRTAKEAHFEQFQDRYSRNTSDLPSTVVAVRQPDGQLKTVTVEEGAPENVQMLLNYLGNQFDALAELKADR